MVTFGPVSFWKNISYKQTSTPSSSLFNTKNTGDILSFSGVKVNEVQQEPVEDPEYYTIQDLKDDIEDIKAGKKYGDEKIDSINKEKINLRLLTFLREETSVVEGTPITWFQGEDTGKAFDVFIENINMDKEDYRDGLAICQELGCFQIHDVEKPYRKDRLLNVLKKVVSFNEVNTKIGYEVNNTLGTIVGTIAIRKTLDGPLLKPDEMLEVIEYVAENIDQDKKNARTENEILNRAFKNLPLDEIKDKEKLEKVDKKLTKNDPERERMISGGSYNDYGYSSYSSRGSSSNRKASEMTLNDWRRNNAHGKTLNIPTLNNQDIKSISMSINREIGELPYNEAVDQFIDSAATRLYFINTDNPDEYDKNFFFAYVKDFNIIGEDKIAERNRLCEIAFEVIPILSKLKVPDKEIVDTFMHIAEFVKEGKERNERDSFYQAFETAYSIVGQLPKEARQKLDAKVLKSGKEPWHFINEEAYDEG